jgi:hypothetical protein
MVTSKILPRLPRMDAQIRKCRLPMAIFNYQCWGSWDASFEIKNGEFQWTGDIEPKTLMYNYMLPPDHMTRYVIPFLEANGLLTPLSLKVVKMMSDEYLNLRARMSTMLDHDMKCCITFLARKRPDLKPHEVLWCAINAVMWIHKPVWKSNSELPMRIRRKVKRDALTEFRKLTRDSGSKIVNKPLSMAMRVLEVYTRPLVTKELMFYWVDSDQLVDVHHAFYLCLDGARRRKILFDYLEGRHPDKETLWHSLVQIFHVHDVANYPGYGTRPMSPISSLTWIDFFAEAREDVPVQFPDAHLRASNWKDSPSTRNDPVGTDEGKQPKAKKKNKSRKRKGAKSAELPAIPEQPDEEEQSVSRELASEDQSASCKQAESTMQDKPALQDMPTTQEPHASRGHAVSQEEPASKKQRLSREQTTAPTHSISQSPKSKSPDENEQEQPKKLSKSQAKRQRKKDKLNESGAPEQTISPTIREPPPSDIDSVIVNEDDGDGALFPRNKAPTNEALVNKKTGQEHPSEAYETVEAKQSKPAEKSAAKSALHDNSDDDMQKALQESIANDSGSWSKVQGRTKSQPKQKQKQRTNNRDGSHDEENWKRSAYASTNIQPARMKAVESTAKSWKDDYRSRRTRLSALISDEGSSKSINDDSSTARSQPTSWSALFKPAGSEIAQDSPQGLTSSANAVDLKAPLTTGPDNSEASRKVVPSVSPHIIMQPERPVHKEKSQDLTRLKVEAGERSTVTPGTDNSNLTQEIAAPENLHIHAPLTSTVGDERPKDLTPSKVAADAILTPTVSMKNNSPAQEIASSANPHAHAQSEPTVDNKEPKDLMPSKVAVGATVAPTADMENSDPVHKTAPPLSSDTFARSRVPMDEEAFKDYDGHKDSSLPPASPRAPTQSEPAEDKEEPKYYDTHEDSTIPSTADGIPSQCSAVSDSAMSHVEQWLASRYAAAFAGLTPAEIENAHWRPQQPSTV